MSILNRRINVNNELWVRFNVSGWEDGFTNGIRFHDGRCIRGVHSYIWSCE